MNNIETMRLALEALTKLNASPHLEDCEGAFDDEIAALRQAIEQAQQAEPVAWIYEDELLKGYPYDAMFEKSRVIDGVRMFPVNIAPPRQPLTDEEIKTIFESNIKHDISDAFGFARAIEAAHGITGEK